MARKHKLLKYFAKSTTISILSFGSIFANAASVCLSENSNLVFNDPNISGNGSTIWAAGFNDGIWMWENNLNCTSGVCESQIPYTGGEVVFRLEGPGVTGYYSPEGGIENFNPISVPFNCDATITNLEAETGALLGSAQIYQDSLASNGQGVAYISTLGSGVELTMVPNADNLIINYTSQLSGKISFYVNDQQSSDVSFDSTGSWLGNYASVVTDTAIPEGASIKFVYEEGDSALNIDSVTFVTDGEAPEENPYKVRIIYHVPADDEERADYKQLMEESIATGQTWILEQMGKTFTLANNGQATVVKSTRSEASFQVPEIWNEIRNDVFDNIGPDSPFESRIIFSSVDGVPLPDGGCIGAGAAGSRVAVMSGDDLRGLALEGTLCNSIGEFDIGRWHGGQLHELLHTLTLHHPKDSFGNSAPGYEGQCVDDQCIMRFGWITFPETYLAPTDIYSLDRSPFLGRQFDQSYNLENVNSQKCLDIRFASTTIGTPVIQFFCFNDGTNFQWQVTPVGNFVQIENNLSLSCITSPDASTASGQVLEIFQCDGRDSSLWDAQEQTDGTVIFQNKASGLCMIVEENSLNDLAFVTQGSCSASSAKWNLNTVEI